MNSMMKKNNWSISDWDHRFYSRVIGKGLKSQGQQERIPIQVQNKIFYDASNFSGYSHFWRSILKSTPVNSLKHQLHSYRESESVKDRFWKFHVTAAAGTEVNSHDKRIDFPTLETILSELEIDDNSVKMKQKC